MLMLNAQTDRYSKEAKYRAAIGISYKLSSQGLGECALGQNYLHYQDDRQTRIMSNDALARFYLEHSDQTAATFKFCTHTLCASDAVPGIHTQRLKRVYYFCCQISAIMLQNA